MANYCHYALHNFSLLPGKFLALPRAERAFIIASIDEYLKAERVQAMKMQNRR